MIRLAALTLALGLSAALAEDIGPQGRVIIVESFPLDCAGPCPETGPTAMSSDVDGDSEADFVTFSDGAPCGLTVSTVCEAQADASSVIEAGANTSL